MKKTTFIACLLIAVSGQMTSQIFVNTTATTNNTDPTYRQGSVAIGKTTAATELLDVNGNIAIPFGNYIGVNNTSITYKRILQTGWDASVGDFLSLFTPGTSAGSQSEKIRILSTGAVGINTISPVAKLHVYEPIVLGTTSGDTKRLFTFSGNAAGSNTFEHNSWLRRDNTAGNGWYSIVLHDGISIDGVFKTPGVDTKTWWERQPYLDQQSWGNANVTYMTLNQGNLCIGQKRSVAHTNAKLMVDGKIVCKDLYVTASSDWPDFVFEANYKLANLYDVRDYFQANKHLPNVPTACEIEEKGINMSEMSAIQMQKIEELTLYIIQLKEEVDALKKQVLPVNTQSHD